MMSSGPNSAYLPLARTADRVLRSMQPMLAEAQHQIESGKPLPEVLGSLLLTGYLAGKGVDPAGAATVVSDLRTAYISQAQRHQDMDGARRGELVRFIRGALKDEASAVLFYTELLNQTKQPDRREYIRIIRDDEQKHFRMLENLHEDLTGEPYEVTPEPTPFSSLREGYKKAMDAEYEAFEEYRRIYLDYPNERLRRVFFELLTDELEHATRFNFLLQELAEHGG